MANPKHLKTLEQGVEAWNKWRENNPKIRPDLRQANLFAAKLRGADLSAVNLSEADLSEANLSEANLHEANLFAADLRGADLSGAKLSEINLSEANLCEANLHQANLHQANLRGADLSEANLRETDLFAADLSETNLIRAKLFAADLRGADLSGVNLSEADLSAANLREAIVSKANLSSADLRGAGLSEAILSEADLSAANLREANLSMAVLYGSKLRGADLRGSNLSGADLSEANLYGADLRGANLSEANLTSAVLTYADCRDANLSKACLTGVILNGISHLGWKIDDVEGMKHSLEKPILEPRGFERIGQDARDTLTLEFTRARFGQLTPIEYALEATLGTAYVIEKSKDRIVVKLESADQYQSAIDAVIPVLAALESVSTGEVKEITVEPKDGEIERVDEKVLRLLAHRFDEESPPGTQKVSASEEALIEAVLIEAVKDSPKGVLAVGSRKWFEVGGTAGAPLDKVSAQIYARFHRLFLAAKDVVELPRAGSED